LLCLILEDDVTFINRKSQAIQRIVTNTLSWFTNDDTTWDCSKRGMGFWKTGYTGNTSICRIVPKKYAACLAENMRNSVYPADIALKIESSRCRLTQSRFLLAQHSGAVSTLGH
jgi:hypothetical protein